MVQITKDSLYQMYVVEKLGPHKIAKHYEVHAKTVYYYVDKFGFDRNKFQNQDLAGKIIGNLEVLELVGKRKNGTNVWKCRKICCGKICKKDTAYINQKVVECTCFKKYNRVQPKKSESPSWKGIGSLSGNRFQAIRYCAKNRGIALM